MKSIHIDFQHFDTDQEISNIDIICTDKLQHLSKVITCSFAYIKFTNDQLKYNISVKFEFKDFNIKPGEDDFLFIPETDMLFFRTIYQWGLIDLKNKHLKRNEEAFDLPRFYQHEEFIIIEDELYAESVRLNGDIIDHVPIDPPYEVEEFEDRIEYKCEVYGHQVLKTR